MAYSNAFNIMNMTTTKMMSPDISKTICLKVSIFIIFYNSAFEKMKTAEAQQQADQGILNFVKDRSNKLTASKAIRPANRWPDKASYISHFKQK